MGSKLDFSKISVLIVESKTSEQDILAQILMGFGAGGIQRRATAEEALRLLSHETFDLALVSANLAGADGFELIKSIRRSGSSAASMSLLLFCAHVKKGDVLKARDSGANFLITKPISPHILFDRVLWLARSQRVFVQTDTYIGPDRRFKAFGPPPGKAGRRADDLSATLGAPVGENMSQDAIDGFFAPSRVSL